jgi:hypothetical protein
MFLMFSDRQRSTSGGSEEVAGDGVTARWFLCDCSL